MMNQMMGMTMTGTTKCLDVSGKTLKVGTIVQVGDGYTGTVFIIDSIHGDSKLGLTLVKDNRITVFRQSRNVRKLGVEELI